MTARELDDIRYDDLVSEALTLIPRLLPGWTDHNPADPGITLVELFAALTEATGYTVAQYVNATPAPFARLLGHSPRTGESPAATLARAVQSISAVRRIVTDDDLRTAVLGGVLLCDLETQRSHNRDDVVSIYPVGDSVTATSAVRRVGATAIVIDPAPVRPGERLVLQTPGEHRLGEVVTVATVGETERPFQIGLSAPVRKNHPTGSEVISVAAVPSATTAVVRPVNIGDRTVLSLPADLPDRFVVVLGAADEQEELAARRLARATAVVDTVSPLGRVVNVLVVPPASVDVADDLDQQVYDLLRELLVATTRAEVHRPRFVELDLDVTVVRQRYGLERTDALRASVAATLATYLDPITGGRSGSGWEFGAPVYRSALNQLLEAVNGVDHVYRLAIDGDTQADVWQLSSDPDEAGQSLVKVGRLAVTVLDAAEGW
jgi:hypothetical protein